MRRTATDTHRLIFPFQVSEADKMRITYSQDGEIILEKTLEDVDIDGRKAIVHLTTEETALFDVGLAEVQAKIGIRGEVVATKEHKFSIRKILNPADLDA
jgi:hypothetical protein